MNTAVGTVDVTRDKAGEGAGGKQVFPYRLGAPSKGLYPQISRTKLAKVMGKHVTTITGYLIGRVRPGLEEAMWMAELIGVGVEELNGDLQRVQGEYRARGKRGKRKLGGMGRRKQRSKG